MARKPNEEPDLDLTDELLFAGNNLQLERFGRAEAVAGRTPDFRVRRDGVGALCSANLLPTCSKRAFLIQQTIPSNPLGLQTNEPYGVPFV
jgi:hypothetical protein